MEGAIGGVLQHGKGFVAQHVTQLLQLLGDLLVDDILNLGGLPVTWLAIQLLQLVLGLTLAL